MTLFDDPEHPVMNRYEPVPTQRRKIHNDTVSRKEELPLPFPLSGSLVCNLRSIVCIPTGVMGDRRHERPECCTVALQSVGHPPEWYAALTFQEFAKETLSGTPVAPALDENVDHFTILIQRTPQILSLAVDPDVDFIQKPRIP